MNAYTKWWAYDEILYKLCGKTHPATWLTQDPNCIYFFWSVANCGNCNLSEFEDYLKMYNLRLYFVHSNRIRPWNADAKTNLEYQALCCNLSEFVDRMRISSMNLVCEKTLETQPDHPTQEAVSVM